MRVVLTYKPGSHEVDRIFFDRDDASRYLMDKFESLKKERGWSESTLRDHVSYYVEDKEVTESY